MAAPQHLAREHPRIDPVPRAAADAIRNAEGAHGVIEEEGILAALGVLGRMRNVVRSEHQMQIGDSGDCMGEILCGSIGGWWDPRLMTAGRRWDPRPPTGNHDTLAEPVDSTWWTGHG
eukprot:1703898-Prymnesium_polylepis.1